MNRADNIEPSSIRIKPYALILVIFWSIMVGLSLIWNIDRVKQGILDIARIRARDSFIKDVVYRRWNAGHGGVYAPVSINTPPNPYLKVPVRDITLPSGAKLTLVNPAYMTRQVHAIMAEAYGIREHITSLNPIRPANAPDPWETEALKAFKHGAKEVSSLEKMEGDDYMRLMRPLITERGCLKCHAVQGYKLGEIRGGISVSVPMSSLWAVESSNFWSLSLGHGFLWAVGLLGIGFGAHRLNKQIIERKQAEERNRKLTLLKESLIASGELPHKLKRITDSIVELFNADIARIWITKTGDLCDSGCIHAEAVSGPHVCKNRDTCLHLLASSGRYENTDGGHRRVPFGAYKIGRIASGIDVSFLTNDVTNDPRVHDHEWTRNLGLQSFAGYRLLSDAGESIGVLALFSKRTISSDTNVLLQGLANTASHVIQISFKEEALRAERDKAIDKVKVLSGLLPICSSCKKIRDDQGYWNNIESYITEHSDADFTHSICPDCFKKLYPDFKYNKKDDDSG